MQQSNLAFFHRPRAESQDSIHLVQKFLRSLMVKAGLGCPTKKYILMNFHNDLYHLKQKMSEKETNTGADTKSMCIYLHPFLMD